MAKTFDDENGSFFVLVNREGQHSLWPISLQVPSGWTVAFEADTRRACLDYVEQHWTDMRPKSLIASLESRDRDESHQE